VGLDDGSVDLFREGKRIRTLPAVGKAYPILELRFSPDEHTIAVTRTSDTWQEQTAFHDVDSGALRGTIPGGKVAFDATSSFVAGRGGVYAIDGREIAKFREGFYVQRIDGAMVDMKSVPGNQEVMAGDYVARGFFEGKAFFAGATEVELVDPTTAAVTKIAATCAPSFKVGSDADPSRGRVIGVCLDAVLVTDLAQRTTKKIKATIQSSRSWNPEVVFPPSGSAFLVDGLATPTVFVDPDSGTASPATDDQRRAWLPFTKGERCVRKGTARVAIPCEAPAMRDDGAFRLLVFDGLTLTSTSPSKVVADWGMKPGGGTIPPYDPSAFRDVERGVALAWHGGAVEARTPQKRRLRWRVGPALANPGAPEPFPATAACGKGEPWLVESTDAFAVYKLTEAVGGRAKESVCQCSASGCARHDVPMTSWFGAIADDGALLVHDIAYTQEKTVLRLRRAGKPEVKATLEGSCSDAAFGATGKIWVDCTKNEQDAILELSPVDLSVVARRAAPPLGRPSTLARWGDDLAVIYATHDGADAAIVPPDWVANASAREKATLHARPDFGILHRADGKVEIAGDDAAAAFAIRCYDGTTLRPFDACRDALGVIHK
jgi:hypothetical protein